MTSLPTIGVRMHGGMAARACIELAELADRHSFYSVWFAENAFNRGVLPAMTGAILATKQLRVGVGVFNPYNRHPTLIAMEMGALDELSGGRAQLGIGSGIGDRVMKMGLSYDKPIGAVRDAAHIVRAMMRGEAVDYTGAVFSAKGVRLEFPLHRPDFPIYVAGMGDQAVRLAGEVGDGLIISNLCPPGYTARAIGIVGEGAVKAGRATPQTIVQYVPCVARKNRDEARKVAMSIFGRTLAEYWTLGERTPAYRVAMVRESGIPESDVVAAVNRIKAGEDPVNVLDDRYLAAYTIAGNADDCLTAMRAFGKVGVTELVVTFQGTQPAEDMAYLGATLKANR
ncbi:MAG: LLM class flavin-dependent oxidoreductase [Burkholderiales bacterium]